LPRCSSSSFGSWSASGRISRISLAGLWDCLLESLWTTAMMMFIFVGAWIFSYFVVQTKVPSLIVEVINDLSLAPWMVILVIVAFYVVLGCFLDSVAIVVVTVPVFLPVILAQGYDAVWYGVLMVVVVEIGLITPPVGMNVFVMRAQLPDVPMGTIFKGIWPFLIADFVLVAILLIWPDLALWLPRLLY
jgi:TRAP-type C4-dicarboxylate transport system permease large subunit